MSEFHAKAQLDDFCKKKYAEYQYIVIKSCQEKFDLENGNGKIGDINDLFGNAFGDLFEGKKK
jgi:hypothetical protein